MLKSYRNYELARAPYKFDPEARTEPDGTEVRSVGGLCNSYGFVRIRTSENGEGPYFWSLEDWKGVYWEEIPKTLYDELLKFEVT